MVGDESRYRSWAVGILESEKIATSEEYSEARVAEVMLECKALEDSVKSGSMDPDVLMAASESGNFDDRLFDDRQRRELRSLGY